MLWQTLNEHFISGFGLYSIFPLFVAYSFLPSCELLNIFRIHSEVSGEVSCLGLDVCVRLLKCFSVTGSVEGVGGRA